METDNSSKMNELTSQDIPDEIKRIVLSAKARGEIPEPILFTYNNVLENNLDRKLANYISGELNRNLKVVLGAECFNIRELALKLQSVDSKSVVFIDDISVLYQKGFGDFINTAIKTQHFPITIGKGSAAKLINLPLPPFGWICSIPRDSKYIRSIRGTFGYVIDLNLFDDTKQFIKHYVDRYQIPEEQYLISRLTKKDISCEIVPLILIQCRDYFTIYHNLMIEDIEHIVKKILVEINC